MSKDDVYRSGIRKNLNRILRELTDDGKLDFESVPFQNLKAESEKQDEKCAQIVNEVLLETASRSGCSDRGVILKLIDEFFRTSKLFRDTILDDPTEFLEIMLETNPIRNPLPGSKKDGEQLKIDAIAIIKHWEQLYAKHDARMKCLVVTLRKTKFVDYENGQKEIEEERKRKVEERKAMLVERTLSVYKSKFEEIKEDVERLKMELEITMEMLVPTFEDVMSTPIDIPSTSSPSESFEIVIKNMAPVIKVNEGNDAIVESFLGAKLQLIHRVQTMRKIAKRLLPLKQPADALAQEIINYRDGIKHLVLKADEIRIQHRKKPAEKPKRKFDDDFIDVEISIDDILMVQYSDPKTEDSGSGDVPKSITTKKPVKKEAPKPKTVPFGLDLKYWGEERKDVEVPKNNADCHRFWRSADESTVSGTVHETVYTQRQFTFIGETPKIDRECLARLPSGALCKRKDMFKCPLHGPIIDRDAEGNAVNDEDRRREIQRKEKKLQRETEEYSRRIFKEHESKSKRKRKHEVETSASEGVRSRLQKKLLDPKTIQRVSADITSAQRSRLEKNFSHQFSHL